MSEPTRGLPEHVTTPLLTLVTARSLDEDYAHVAARRAEANGGVPVPAQRNRWWMTGLAVLVFGLLAGAVVAQTTREAEMHELSRAALIDRIASQRELVGGLQAELNTLVGHNQETVAHNNRLQGQLDDMDAIVTRLGSRTGFAAVHGPGVRIEVDNAEGADPNSTIRDEDLAILVDGLWHAGAEAIAINDQRVTALGGIRNTNRAIHVNGRPVTAPYVVSAIGDRATLQARLLESSQGQEWFALVNGLGFRYAAQNVDDVDLPAARWQTLRHVTELTTQGPDGEEGVTP